jgi:chromate transporter
MAESPTPRRSPPYRSFLRYFLGLGTWGFGGPIATVGYILRDLVERDGWVDRDDFLDGVALGQTMPGPLAAQVVMWIGYLRKGAVGALGTAVAFILPSFIAVLAVAVVYVRYQGLKWVQAVFYGIAPAVMAVIAVAAVRLAILTNRRDVRLWVISAITMAVTAVTGAEIALLFLAAGLLMMVWEAPPRFRKPTRADVMATAPVVAQLASVEPGTQVALFLFFLKAGAFIFGSGLAIVPFLREGVVVEHGWLTEGQFLDAVAMGLITPGPVVITATFIGYLVGGWLGAGVATVAIFLPIYLGVIVPGPWFLRHRDHPRVKGFVKGATAAAAGAIGGATVVLARGAVVDWATAGIAAGGLAFVLVVKNREPLLVVLAALAGLALYPLAA